MSVPLLWDWTECLPTKLPEEERCSPVQLSGNIRKSRINAPCTSTRLHRHVRLLTRTLSLQCPQVLSSAPETCPPTRLGPHYLHTVDPLREAAGVSRCWL